MMEVVSSWKSSLVRQNNTTFFARFLHCPTNGPIVWQAVTRVMKILDCTRTNKNTASCDFRVKLAVFATFSFKFPKWTSQRPVPCKWFVLFLWYLPFHFYPKANTMGDKRGSPRAPGSDFRVICQWSLFLSQWQLMSVFPHIPCF